MATQVKLTVWDGATRVRDYVFDGPAKCTVGRANDCELQLPTDELHWTISRHHCQLDINPPNARVRDLGSRNGTFVNGQSIGGRAGAGARPTDFTPSSPEREVGPGDEIRLGNTILEINVADADDTGLAWRGRREQSPPSQGSTHLPLRKRGV
jgi:pSer/pThr/pTyr-binding forkhead associated (FHA) protein